VKALMQAPIAPASDALFNAVIYTNGELVEAPGTAADWTRLLGRAHTLAESARTLESLAPAERRQPWVDASRALATAATDAAEAIGRRDPDDLLSSGSALYQACTTCHAAYIGRDEP
jgi:hypothetical protein